MECRRNRYILSMIYKRNWGFRWSTWLVAQLVTVPDPKIFVNINSHQWFFVVFQPSIAIQCGRPSTWFGALFDSETGINSHEWFKVVWFFLVLTAIAYSWHIRDRHHPDSPRCPSYFFHCFSMCFTRSCQPSLPTVPTNHLFQQFLYKSLPLIKQHPKNHALVGNIRILGHLR